MWWEFIITFEIWNIWRYIILCWMHRSLMWWEFIIWILENWIIWRYITILCLLHRSLMWCEFIICILGNSSCHWNIWRYITILWWLHRSLMWWELMKIRTYTNRPFEEHVLATAQIDRLVKMKIYMRSKKWPLQPKYRISNDPQIMITLITYLQAATAADDNDRMRKVFESKCQAVSFEIHF